MYIIEWSVSDPLFPETRYPVFPPSPTSPIDQGKPDSAGATGTLRQVSSHLESAQHTAQGKFNQVWNYKNLTKSNIKTNFVVTLGVACLP